jgi:hypothetical protein
MIPSCKSASAATEIEIRHDFAEPGELSRCSARIKGGEKQRESRVIFTALVEQMSQNPESPSRSVGNLESSQLVELAADSVERLLARLPSPQNDAVLDPMSSVLDQMSTWHEFSSGSVDSSQLEVSAAAVRDATRGPARTSGDQDTLARACIRMAADTATAASQMETAETPTARERLLWRARMAAERLRMATELLLRPAYALS